MSNMGDRIHQRRKELGLSMEELGDRVCVNKATVSKWEKGIITNIHRSKIVLLAKSLDCSPTWLMGYTEDKEVANNSAIVLAEIASDLVLLEYVKKLMNLSDEKKQHVYNTIDMME